ncbi:oligosaccharide flippase family protein [Novosphingobium flavum]|uniref:Oligosaccharide flippase family protein n=1 Tax=Novosphingobium flavum TaxID=1778672 RepID=A0A7X1KLX5_9SPHN|nr:oligosaccharide flippase family protein [Novosphingobium flavum]MBC2666044.1 oligosaccharide flippase family protein [Novosphingobium flavum]
MSVRAAAIWAISAQYMSFAIQFIASVVIARWFIGPDDLGLFSIAFAAVQMIALLQDFGVTRYIVGEAELDQRKLASAFALSVTVAWSVAAVALLAAQPIARFYGDPRLLPITAIIAASYLMVPLAIVPQALRQRALDFRSNTMIEIGAAAANAVTAIILAWRGHGALALAWGAFAQQGARMAISQWRNGFTLPRPFSLRGSAPLLRFGGGNSALVLIGAVGMRAPELVIGRMIGAVAVGLFSRASGLAAQLRTLVSGAVAGVFYPAFARLRDSGEPLGPPYVRVVAAYTAVTWPAMAGIAALAEPIIRSLYGERWLAASPMLAWIALAQMCYVALPLHIELPLLTGRMRALVVRNSLDTLASIVLLFAFAPLGVIGAALSRFAHGLCWIAIYFGFLRSCLGFAPRALFGVWLKSGAATLAAVAPVYAGYALWHPAASAGMGQVMLTALAGVGGWLAALWLTRHPAHAEIVETLLHLRGAVLPRRDRPRESHG